MEEAATAFRKEITASGFAMMSECQSSRTIRAADVIAVPLASWNELSNPSAGSDHSRISTTLESDAGTIAIPSSPRVTSDGDRSCSARRRFGNTKVSRHCGRVDISDSRCRGEEGRWTIAPSECSLRAPVDAAVEPVPGVLVGSRTTPHPLTASVSTDQAAG